MASKNTALETWKVFVSLPNSQSLTFSCTPHLTDRPDRRLIEAEFYIKNSLSHTVPQGLHHELEISGSGIAELSEWPGNIPIHIHINPHTKQRFVCVTDPLPTFEAAMAMFRLWCLGTAYALSHEKDFLELYMSAGSPKAFAKELKEKFGIYVI